MSQLLIGEQVGDQDLPRSDLAPQKSAQFAVRDGATYLICGETADGGIHFPAAEHASNVEVGPEGVLYSHSTVHVSASRETPYTIGYVDFPNGLRVLARVRGVHAELGCDVPVRLGNEKDEWFVEPVALEVKQ